MKKKDAESLNQRVNSRLWEKIRLHRMILDLLQGKEGDFGEILYKVQQLSALREKSGRPSAEEEISREGTQGIATRLLELGLIKQLPRKVSLQKLRGKHTAKSAAATKAEKVGWEMEPPTPGSPYCLHLLNGGLFITGAVTACHEDRFETQNSVYILKGLEDRPPYDP